MFSTICQSLCLSVSLCFLVHCGGLSTHSLESSSDSTAATADPVGGNVSPIEFLGNSNTVMFSSLADDDEVVLMLHSYNEENTSSAFQIGASENSQFLSASFYKEAILSADESELFHYQLREWEENLDPAALIQNKDHSISLMASESAESQKVFKVLNSFSSSSAYDTVRATLLHATDQFNFYVDNRNLDSLDASDLEKLAEDFTGVLDDERALFGSESDVDGNGKFSVLFTQTVNSLSGSSGGMVTGFFYAVDLLSSDTYTISNETEIYYTFVPDPKGHFGTGVTKPFAMTNIYPGVLVHEFQHMINFNQHYFVNGGSAEKGWLNEGLSHLVEDIYNADSGGFMAASGLENPARVRSFIENINGTCMTCGTSLGQRGGSYLFIRYLYEQAELGNLPNVSSGAELIDNLLKTSLRGVENIIHAAYGPTGTVADFMSVFGNFGLALYVSNTGLNSDSRLSFLGINLRSEQNDNRATTLDGPAVENLSTLPFVDSLLGNSITYIQIPGKTINENGGQLELKVGSESRFGAFIIY